MRFAFYALLSVIVLAASAGPVMAQDSVGRWTPAGLAPLGESNPQWVPAVSIALASQGTADLLGGAQVDGEEASGPGNPMGGLMDGLMMVGVAALAGLAAIGWVIVKRGAS
jgi:hypothetical protein